MNTDYIYIDKETNVETKISRSVAIKYMKYCIYKITGKNKQWFGNNFVIVEKTI